ncbi:MAG: hypothetical protein JWN41_1319 [Thermoleophilia bacterium]|nr:hypothetical protein [Thermoleophilia bacterium]
MINVDSALSKGLTQLISVGQRTAKLIATAPLELGTRSDQFTAHAHELREALNGVAHLDDLAPASRELLRHSLVRLNGIAELTGHDAPTVSKLGASLYDEAHHDLEIARQAFYT